MKNINEKRDFEQNLTTSEFEAHLKDYQSTYEENLPVALLITRIKKTDETDDDSGDRLINVPFYGNSKLNAFYFYKPISTILIDND